MNTIGEVAFSPRLTSKTYQPWAEVDMYYVYVLYSIKLKKRYIGLTNDLRRRFSEHNRGCSDFTNRGKPWKLVYYEAFINKKDAEREELFLKMGKGRERLDTVLLMTMINI